jgi:hypothetical protein
MASQGSSGETAPITAISDGAAAGVNSRLRAARRPGVQAFPLFPDSREKIGNTCEQSWKINLVCLGKDARMTPRQGIVDRVLTPAGKEPPPIIAGKIHRNFGSKTAQAQSMVSMHGDCRDRKSWSG